MIKQADRHVTLTVEEILDILGTTVTYISDRDDFCAELEARLDDKAARDAIQG